MKALALKDSQKALRAELKIKGLFARQIDISVLVTMGLSNKEVANQLFCTEQTVKRNLKLIYSLLNLKSRTQLLLYCLPLLSDNYVELIQKFNIEQGA